MEFTPDTMESRDTIKEKIRPMLLNIATKIELYGRMIKFSHTIFALPFALSAVILASREHPLTFGTVFFILLAMVGARSAAMGFNRLVDAGLDAKNPRTLMREIPSGKLDKKAAVIFVVLSSIVFLFSAAMLGKVCFYLSFPVLFLLFFYSYTKRFTVYCHIYLGFAISLAPLGAWVAVTNSLSFSILLLSIALLTNIAGFDILYACQDAEFDKNEQLFSIPSRLGIQKALLLSSLLHVVTFSCFVLMSVAFDMGSVYLVAVVVIGVLLVIEHRLVKPDDLSHVHIAFFHINSILSVVLLSGILIDVWLR
jgi:4-hydroxybenzoate polyprenyltransferase